MQDTELIIFDLDGTLIDSRRDLATAVNLMRNDYELSALPVEQVMGYIGGGIRALVERSLFDTTAEIDTAVRACFQHYLAHLHDETVLYNGVEKGLLTLRDEGFGLAVMTNKPSHPTDVLLDHFSIRPLFSAVLGGDDAPELKPHPAALIQISTELSVDANKVCMVGDHVYDLEAARRAGMSSVFVSYGIGHAGEERPTHACSTFDEVVDFFVS